MKELVLFNFTMDSNHPLLSHQPDIARLLASHFDQVTVITNDGSSFIEENLHVYSINWKQGALFGNLFRFYSTAIPLIFKKRKKSVIFSHMTDLQSCLISPLTRLLRIPHFLWYAHTHKSLYLRFANIFVNGIVTSTQGSCPIISEKVFPIGQAIDENLFELSIAETNTNLHRGMHIGRFDPSKNLDLIFSEINVLRSSFPQLSITQVGSPSTDFAKLKCELLQDKWNPGISDGWISIMDSVNRGELPMLMKNFDVFFHAYVGSLDKSLIEATMSGLPVVTINPEYISEFGSWGKNENVSLSTEYRSILSMSPISYSEEVQRRYMIALERHSRSKWIHSLVGLLLDEDLTSDRGDL
jgi:glycosyltransferase involved in cell wall biosynthesis